MKLVRFEHEGAVRTGAEVDGGFADLHLLEPGLTAHAAPGDMRALLAAGETVLASLSQALSGRGDGARVDAAVARRLAPIANPPKIICSWVNYPNPAVQKLPSVPIFFSKYASAIIGPGQTIRLPRIGDQIVVEPELAAVIGTPGRHISAARALDHVAGYTIVNDVTAFSHRLQVLLGSAGPYMMAKTFDTFAPMGPCLVTRDEIPDPHALEVRQWQNEVLRTQSNTAKMLFRLPELIAYISQFFTLEPGDVLLTGSPPPDGPLSFLADADTVRIEIQGIGTLVNPVAAETSPVA